jgi:hypothetical protein
MASQLLFINIEFLNQSSARFINNLSFYSPSTILNLRQSLSETLSIPSDHFHFFQNHKQVNDQFRLIDKDSYQILLHQPIQNNTSASGIYIAFFHHQTIHLLNAQKKKVYTSVDEPKLGYSIVYVDWDTFEDEYENARSFLKNDLCKEFGLDPTSSLFGIHLSPFQYIHIYQEFLESFLEEEEEPEIFKFDPEDNVDGDLLVD